MVKNTSFTSFTRFCCSVSFNLMYAMSKLYKVQMRFKNKSKSLLCYTLYTSFVIYLLIKLRYNIKKFNKMLTSCCSRHWLWGRQFLQPLRTCSCRVPASCSLSCPSWCPRSSLSTSSPSPLAWCRSLQPQQRGPGKHPLCSSWTHLMRKVRVPWRVSKLTITILNMHF